MKVKTGIKWKDSPVYLDESSPVFVAGTGISGEGQNRIPES